MCFVYIFFGVTWLILLFMQWRDLLQIQFWIGGVILLGKIDVNRKYEYFFLKVYLFLLILGMVEKASFYAEYYELNLTGRLDNIYNIMIMAEVISCLKRTLARTLVIIVSLGFGIVKWVFYKPVLCDTNK